MNKRLDVIFSGRVQGVGFRFTAESAACALGIGGWVRNLSDGRVEIVAEGEEKDLNDLLSRIDDEFSGYIREKSVSWKPATGEFKEFGIKF